MSKVPEQPPPEPEQPPPEHEQPPPEPELPEASSGLPGTSSGAPPRSRLRLRAALTCLALQFQATRVGAAAMFGTAAVTGLLPALAAWFGKLLFDEIGHGGDADTGRATALALAVAGVGAVTAVLTQLAGYLDEVVRQRLVVTVEDRLFARVNEFRGLRHFESPAFHDRLRLAQEASQDAPHNITMFSQSAVRAVATVTGFTGVLFAVWPPMVGLLFLVGGAAFVARLHQARRQAEVSEIVSGKYRRRLFYRGLLTDPRAAKEIRLFGLGGFLHTRLVTALGDATSAELRVARRGVLVQSGFALLNTAVTGLGTVVVAIGAAHGRFTVGDVTLFIAAAAGIQATFGGIVTQAGMAVEGIRLFGHYTDLMETPDDLGSGSDLGSGGEPVPALRHTIELRDVWFRYDPSGPWVLRGVNLTLTAGTAVGLVGRNGAGKSTLVKLLCRFYDPVRGTILWDGADIRTLDVARLRRRIGVTFQDYMAYDLTAQENIGVGDLDRLHDRDAVRTVARAAGIDEKLSSLPDGYGTLLSRVQVDDYDASPGVTLSGGQWQRVALARSLLRTDADLLILDEPSSALDAQAEHEINAALRRHREGRTSLLISHRLSALRDADVIVVMTDGAVAEAGTHDELMGAEGQYASLFTLQAAGYQDTRVG
ncbi:ABC transporter ATP-binding protein/permease [Streptomyces sp. NBC_01775]|uniref:ABC transporter ATP-binding protein n=1 Tax=Streptomyces sp. NBC_01775 TaxID=2975939 RepID=UPI002DD8A182|nr:ABC transporter ATP-binding protein [Streptomyces sp. NBC_01775]WSB79563.1 ABC transporter ATP-binding protein/permease [Streptomyces sp. NBC_01775]